VARVAEGGKEKMTMMIAAAAAVAASGSGDQGAVRSRKVHQYS